MADARVTRNRELLYETAIALFSKNGFDDTTMNDIAEASGLSRASVFNHYPSKLDFLSVFFRRFTAEILTFARKSRRRGLRGKMRALFAAIDPISKKNKKVIAALAKVTPIGPLESVESELDDDMLNFFLEVIDEGRKQGELRAGIKDQFLADLLLSLITVTLHGWVSHGQKTHLSDELNARFDALYWGIANN